MDEYAMANPAELSYDAQMLRLNLLKVMKEV